MPGRGLLLSLPTTPSALQSRPAQMRKGQGQQQGTYTLKILGVPLGVEGCPGWGTCDGGRTLWTRPRFSGITHRPRSTRASYPSSHVAVPDSLMPLLLATSLKMEDCFPLGRPCQHCREGGLGQHSSLLCTHGTNPSLGFTMFCQMTLKHPSLVSWPWRTSPAPSAPFVLTRQSCLLAHCGAATALLEPQRSQSGWGL